MLSNAEQIDRSAQAARSQARHAYDAIRTDILSGRHSPGKKLKILDLAAELSVSPGAVREALSRLVPEQLVVSREQRGFAAAPLSITDLEQLTDLRCEIESVACRRSVSRGGISWEVELITAARRLQASPMRTNPSDKAPSPDWLRAHAAFHRALVAAAGNDRLLALYTQLYEQSERYRGLSINIPVERDVPGEHEEILAMALKRDADALVRSVTFHIRETARLIVQSTNCDATRSAD